MAIDLKIRLMRLGKKQNDLIPELKKKGIQVYPADVSNVLNDKYPSKQGEIIGRAIDEILTEWEKSQSTAV